MARKIPLTVKTVQWSGDADAPATMVPVAPTLSAVVKKSASGIRRAEEAKYIEADKILYVRYKRNPAMTALLAGEDIRVEVDGKDFEVIKTLELTPPKIKWVGLYLVEVDNGS
jgi:predicted acyl esterase